MVSGNSKNRNSKSGKKKPDTGSRTQKPTAKKSGGQAIWVVGAVLLAAVAAVAVLTNGGSKSPGQLSPQEPGQVQPQQPGQVSPEERKYIGRFLPAGYQEPKITESSAYSSTVKMSNLTATQGQNDISIPRSEVASKRLVYFEYAKPGDQPLPMIAYAKPSGRLFVGVSYCPPCQGKGQRIESDGTLTCETCGTKRDPETQAGINGPCKLYPLDELPSKISGDKIVVEKSALDGWTPQPLDRKIGG